MKKFVVLLLSGATILALGVACDPAQFYSTYYIKNNTSQSLELRIGNRDKDVASTINVVAPGDSIGYSGTSVFVKKKDKLYFDWLVQELLARWGEEVSLKVSSEEGALLKEWCYSDKYGSGKQFFNEPFWRHYDVSRGETSGISIQKDIWIFDISQEDIAQK